MRLLPICLLLCLSLWGCSQHRQFRQILQHTGCGHSHSPEDMQRDVDFLRQYTQRYPKKEKAWYILGMRLYSLRQFEQSVLIWDKMIETDPEHVSALSNRAVCKIFLDQPQAAEADLRRCLELGFDEAIFGDMTISEYLAQQPK